MAEYTVCPWGTFVLCCGVIRATLGLHLLISEALGISPRQNRKLIGGTEKPMATVSKSSQVVMEAF